MRWPLVAAGVAVVVGLSGCGGAGSDPAAKGSSKPDDGSSALHAVKVAYQKTTKAKTAKFSLNEDVQASGKGSTKLVGAGAIDFTTKDAAFTMKLPSGMKMQSRIIDGVSYMHLPAAAQAPKPWLKIDINKLVKARTGKTLQQLAQQAGDTPSQPLSYLKGVSSEVTEKGTATVRGTETTHYHAIVDLDKATAGLKGHAAKAALKKTEKALGGHTLPLELFLDDQGRVRREQMTVPSNTEKFKGQADLTIDFFDFGAPVRVSAPPAGQTMDLADLTKGNK